MSVLLRAVSIAEHAVVTGPVTSGAVKDVVVVWLSSCNWDSFCYYSATDHVNKIYNSFSLAVLTSEG